MDLQGTTYLTTSKGNRYAVKFVNPRTAASLLERVTIRTWLMPDMAEDDTVIRAIYDGLHDPQYTVEQEGLLGGAYYYHCEGHLPFHIACMAQLDGANIGIAAITNYPQPKVHVYVSPEHRRKGLGRALLDALAERFPLAGQGFRGLYTAESAALYKSMGIQNSRMYPASVDFGNTTTEADVSGPARLEFTLEYDLW